MVSRVASPFVAVLLLLSWSTAALNVAKPKKIPSPARLKEIALKTLEGITNENGPLRSLNFAMQESTDKHQGECECLNWKELYGQEEAKLKCGDGLEMFSYANGRADEGTRLAALRSENGQKMCRKFFERLNNNFCVNVGQHDTGSEWHNGQWCYVDARKCGRLNGGMHVAGSLVSWKLCNERDSRLREASVEDLTVLSKVDDVDMALLTKMAYPVAEGQWWWQTQGAWDVYLGFPSKVARNAMEPQRLEAMQKLQESKQPMVFLNTKNGMPPFGVVMGTKAYEIQRNLKTRNATNPSTFNQAICVNGCTPWGW